MEIIIEFLIQLILPIIIEVGLVKWNWLTVTGAVAAGFLAFVVLILAKWSIWPLVVFLVLGSLAGKIRSRKIDHSLDSESSLELLDGDKIPKAGFEALNDGGDAKQGKARDHWQVLANGGIFMLLAFLAFANGAGWLNIYLGIQSNVVSFGETCNLLALISLSVSCADTLSSDIGRVWGGNPRNILSGKKMIKGVSGGVTFAGFVGAFLGAAAISVFAFYSDFTLLGDHKNLFWLVLIFGVFGSIMDSVLGAIFQAKYLDETGKLVDSSAGGRRALGKGIEWVTNDVVNAITGVLMLLVAVMYLCW
jgi:uncharacterized membrane protein